jgi:predicted PurR-regulated permease PerM
MNILVTILIALLIALLGTYLVDRITDTPHERKLGYLIIAVIVIVWLFVPGAFPSIR